MDSMRTPLTKKLVAYLVIGIIVCLYIIFPIHSDKTGESSSSVGVVVGQTGGLVSDIDSQRSRHPSPKAQATPTPEPTSSFARPTVKGRDIDENTQREAEQEWVKEYCERVRKRESTYAPSTDLETQVLRCKELEKRFKN